MDTITHKLPFEASQYLAKNFPDGFQFDEFSEESDASGHHVFNIHIVDGEKVHHFIFSQEGTVCKHDIVPAYLGDDYEERMEFDEFHEDDY